MEFPNFRDFTLWNWLTLLFGVLSIISVTNAILSLKTRFTDWKATKSKVMFEQRVKVYKERVKKFKVYDSFPSVFIADIVYFLGNTLAAIFGLLLFEFIALIILYIGEPKTGAELFYLLLFLDAFLLTMAMFGIGVHWVEVTGDYKKQGDFTMKIIELVNDGEEKGYISDKKKVLEEIMGESDT